MEHNYWTWEQNKESYKRTKDTRTNWKKILQMPLGGARIFVQIPMVEPQPRSQGLLSTSRKYPGYS